MSSLSSSPGNFSSGEFVLPTPYLNLICLVRRFCHLLPPSISSPLSTHTTSTTLHIMLKRKASAIQPSIEDISKRPRQQPKPTIPWANCTIELIPQVVRSSLEFPSNTTHHVVQFQRCQASGLSIVFVVNETACCPSESVSPST